jgi:hypothetical protein
MKKIAYLLTLSLFVVAVLMSCGSKEGEKTDEKGNTIDPKAYNDKLIGIQTQVISKFLDMSKTFTLQDKSAIDQAYAKVLKATGEAVEAVKLVGPYDGDDTFRQKLQALLEFYKSIAEIEYKEMIAIISKGPSITPEDMAKLEELNKSIRERENKLDSEMSQAQAAFTAKFGVKLKANELQKDIDSLKQ